MQDFRQFQQFYLSNIKGPPILKDPTDKSGIILL